MAGIVPFPTLFLQHFFSPVSVFRGTRVPFQALLDYLEGGQTLDEFLDDFSEQNLAGRKIARLRHFRCSGQASASHDNLVMHLRGDTNTRKDSVKEVKAAKLQAQRRQQLRLGELLFAEARALGWQNLRGYLQRHASKRQEPDLGNGPSCPHQKTP
jgi:hypothetical protein